MYARWCLPCCRGGQVLKAAFATYHLLLHLSNDLLKSESGDLLADAAKNTAYDAAAFRTRWRLARMTGSTGCRIDAKFSLRGIVKHIGRKGSVEPHVGESL